MVEPYYEDDRIRLYCGDARNMAALNRGSVQLIVTSPPYWDIKNYRNSGQIGLGQSYEEYTAELHLVAEECKRVLAPGRFLCWVIGTRVSHGQLKHIPSDCIEVFGDHGYTLRKEFIWKKPKGTQGLWQRGTTQFLKDNPFPCQAAINIQHEFILVFQREGEFKPPRRSRLSEDFIKRVAWSVWELPVSRTKGHPAPFPIQLPERLTHLFSYPGDTVLDPFAGTGATLIAARNAERIGVGYEISEEYCQLAVAEISKAPTPLLSEG
ncbi:MAG: site-specific DNA-methyltransferase [Armatimonadota bacterium]|nr:site-specific DNA-methyltransferase [Armatimonadota bacterium]